MLPQHLRPPGPRIGVPPKARRRTAAEAPLVLDYEGHGMLIFTHDVKTRERALSFRVE